MQSKKQKDHLLGRSIQKIGVVMGREEGEKQNKNTDKKASGRKFNKRWIKNALFVLFLDILVVYFSFFFALFIRFDMSFRSIPKHYLNRYIWIMPLWCILTCVVFYLFKLYHVRDVINITASSAIVPVVFRLFKKRKFSVFLPVFTPIKGFVPLTEN